MSYTFEAEEVSVSPKSRSVYYVDVTVDADADTIFAEIEKDVDHDNMMACLTRSEVFEYFEIGVGE